MLIQRTFLGLCSFWKRMVGQKPLFISCPCPCSCSFSSSRDPFEQFSNVSSQKSAWIDGDCSLFKSTFFFKSISQANEINLSRRRTIRQKIIDDYPTKSKHKNATIKTGIFKKTAIHLQRSYSVVDIHGRGYIIHLPTSQINTKRLIVYTTAKRFTIWFKTIRLFNEFHCCFWPLKTNPDRQFTSDKDFVPHCL